MALDEHVIRLAKGKNLATVVTLMPDGQPQALLTWVDTDGEHVLVNTEPQRQRAKNVKRDPRITVLIHSATDPWDWAEVRGHVVDIVDGQAARDHIDATVGEVRRHQVPQPDRAERSHHPAHRARQDQHLRALTRRSRAPMRSGTLPDRDGVAPGALDRRLGRARSRRGGTDPRLADRARAARRRTRRTRLDRSAPDRLPIVGDAHRAGLHRGVRRGDEVEGSATHDRPGDAPRPAPRSKRWLETPVEHVRDVRTEFLVKLALLDRAGESSRTLVERQIEHLDPVVRAVSTRAAGEGFDLVLTRWRREQALAVDRFLRSILADEQVADPPRNVSRGRAARARSGRSPRAAR